MVTQCCLSHRIIGKRIIIKTGPFQAMQGLVSDFGSCFKLCYVLLNNRELKAQLSFQASSDLLAKIMENFQKTSGEDKKSSSQCFCCHCSVFPGTSDGGLFHWRWNFN